MYIHRVRIGIKEAEYALGDKNRLDAFCLLLKMKFLFRSSDLNLTSYNKCGALLHMDRAKLKNLLEFGCKVGYFRRETNNKGSIRYVAQRIHSDKEYSYKLRRGDLTKLTFAALKNLVRRIVLENHIRKQEDAFNTHSRGVEGVTRKTIRNARKRESRMLKKEFCEEYRGLSYDRIGKVLKGTMYQAVKIVNDLAKRGVVKKRSRISKVNVDAATCIRTFNYRDHAGKRIVFNAKSRGAYCIQSNVYAIRKDTAISISNSGLTTD